MMQKKARIDESWRMSDVERSNGDGNASGAKNSKGTSSRRRWRSRLHFPLVSRRARIGVVRHFSDARVHLAHTADPRVHRYVSDCVGPSVPNLLNGGSVG